MMRSIVAFGVGCLACASAALAQAQGSDSSGTNIADRTPRENVAPGNVAKRAPGSWVRSAIARHQNLINERLRGDGTDDEESQSPSGGTTGGTTSSGGLLGGLSGLLSGGGLSDLLNLADQFGINVPGLTGGTGGNTSGGTGGTTLQDVQDAGAQDALAQLLALQQAMGGGGLTSKALVDGAASDAGTGGLDSSKLAQRAQEQTPTEEEDSFRTRLFNSWLNTIFTALTFAFQSQDFIDALADGLRPIIAPDSTGDGGTDGDGSNGGGNGNGGNGNGGSTIDDLGNDSVVRGPLAPAAPGCRVCA